VADIIITGAFVMDGTGNPGFRASVAIDKGHIRILRGDRDIPTATRAIDAGGRVIAPGFIDMHSHSGLMILRDRTHGPKVMQGVTTEVIGVDGNSYAPFKKKNQLMDFVRMNAGLDGDPHLLYEWSDIPSYLAEFDKGCGVNIAMMVGNSALRICAVGWEQAEASTSAVQNMRSMLREALEEGAFGLSSGLDYPPGSYASTGELVSLASVAASFGSIYHTHVRYALGDGILDPFREAVQIARESGAPLHITHLYARAAYPRGSGPIIGLVETERDSGLDVTFDTYPYEWSGTRLSILLPQWFQSGGPAVTLARLRDAEWRKKVHTDLEDRGVAEGFRRTLEYRRVGNLSAANAELENLTVAQIARIRSADPVDVFMDLLAEENLRVAAVAPGPVGSSLKTFVSHPLSMVGTDSMFIGTKPSPRTYGSFPRILGEFVRDERMTSLSDAIRRMTSHPAQRLGLSRRGLIKDGYHADLVIFDPATVRSAATYDDPCRYPVGIEYVFVNGTAVVDEGAPTGALPGRALRRGHDE
jgi:N-acyl-D-amino-acid deacylase